MYVGLDTKIFGAKKIRKYFDKTLVQASVVLKGGSKKNFKFIAFDEFDFPVTMGLKLSQSKDRDTYVSYNYAKDFFDFISNSDSFKIEVYDKSKKAFVEILEVKHKGTSYASDIFFKCLTEGPRFTEKFY